VVPGVDDHTGITAVRFRYSSSLVDVATLDRGVTLGYDAALDGDPVSSGALWMRSSNCSSRA
jgi:hypothetical protein